MTVRDPFPPGDESWRGSSHLALVHCGFEVRIWKEVYKMPYLIDGTGLYLDFLSSRQQYFELDGTVPLDFFPESSSILIPLPPFCALEVIQWVYRSKSPSLKHLAKSLSILDLVTLFLSSSVRINQQY